MLQPKRVKHRKMHRIKYEGPTKGNGYIAYGEFGIASNVGAWITDRQIEAARVAISRHLGKTGKMFIRIFPQMSKTKKPLEVRMGSGKGNPEFWVAVVKKGTIMFEVSGISKEEAQKAFYAAGNKLPVTWTFIEKGEDKHDIK